MTEFKWKREGIPTSCPVTSIGKTGPRNSIKDLLVGSRILTTPSHLCEEEYHKYSSEAVQKKWQTRPDIHMEATVWNTNKKKQQTRSHLLNQTYWSKRHACTSKQNNNHKPLNFITKKTISTCQPPPVCPEEKAKRTRRPHVSRTSGRKSEMATVCSLTLGN